MYLSKKKNDLEFFVGKEENNKTERNKENSKSFISYNYLLNFYIYCFLRNRI